MDSVERLERVKQWLYMMGYDQQIPATLGNVCNNATEFIWEQLMQKVKPKLEVENVRRNLIIHRLNSKGLERQDEYSYPLEEIENYKKKQQLLTKVQTARQSIEEKLHKLNILRQNNNLKYVTIEQLKSKIKEQENRAHLLKRRCELLEKDIEEASEKLSYVKRLTPVELDETSNHKEIMETLEKCAEKLKNVVKQMPVPDSTNTTVVPITTKKYFSAQKSVTKPISSTFESYLARSESKGTSRKINATSNKENIETVRARKSLFSEKTHEPAKKRNSSLGLLPESILNEEDNEDIYQPAGQQDFSMVPQKLQKTTKLDTNEIDFILSINNPKVTKQFLSQCHTISHFSTQKSLDINSIVRNKEVSTELSELLHKHNRQSIRNCFQKLVEQVQMEIASSCVDETVLSKQKGISRDDMARLHFEHSLKCLQIKKQDKKIMELRKRVEKQKKQVLNFVKTRGYSNERLSEAETLLNMHLTDFGLNVLLNSMKKDIHAMKKIEVTNELEITLAKTTKIREEIVSKVNMLEYLTTVAKQTLESIYRTRESTSESVQCVIPFVANMSWALPLSSDVCAEEVKVFEDFPLEYNRRCTFTNRSVFFRDLVTESVPHIDMDSETIYMVNEILESPFNTPEAILLNVMKMKRKLEMFKALPGPTRDFGCKNYTLEELQRLESYVDYALDKLLSAGSYSSLSTKTMATVSSMKKAIQLWIDMPIKDFLSDKRLVDGHCYKHYEAKFDEFYKNL